MSANSKNNLTINKKVSVFDVLNKIKEEFINFSIEREEQTIKYLDNMLFYNKAGYKYYKASYSLKEAYEREYNYIVSVCDYINKEAVVKGYVPIFLTLTLPSKFHPTTTKNGKRTFNSKFEYSFEDYVKKGYEALYYAFRVIMKNLTRGNKQKGVKIPFFRVVEMHKDFTPHFHIVLFIHKGEFVEKMTYLYTTIAELVAEGSIGEQFKVEILDDVSKGAAYVQKYLRKAYLSDNEEDIYLLDGWRKMNKIRMFTHSQTYLKKQDFIKILNDFVENEEHKIKDCL